MSREGAGSLPGQNQEPETGTLARGTPFQRGIIIHLFKAVKNALTRKDDQPAPEPKRKRREDTGRSFRFTARKLFRRAVRIPAAAYYRATLYLADTLDWLHLWHHHDDQHFSEDVHAAPSDHLYPHP